MVASLCVVVEYKRWPLCAVFSSVFSDRAHGTQSHTSGAIERNQNHTQLPARMREENFVFFFSFSFFAFLKLKFKKIYIQYNFGVVVCLEPVSVCSRLRFVFRDGAQISVELLLNYCKKNHRTKKTTTRKISSLHSIRYTPALSCRPSTPQYKYYHFFESISEGRKKIE